MAAQNHCLNIFHTDIGFLSDKLTVTRTVQHAGHTHDLRAVFIKIHLQPVYNGIQRISNRNYHGVFGIAADALTYCVGNFQVCGEQLFTRRHGTIRAACTRNTGRINNHVRPINYIVSFTPNRPDIGTDNRSPFSDVQAFAFRKIGLLDVHQGHFAGQFAGNNFLHQHTANISAADNSNLV